MVRNFLFYFFLLNILLLRLITNEMFTSKFKPYASTICSIVNWSGIVVIGIGFSPFQKQMGPYSFIPFIVVLFLGIIWISFSFTETNGKSLEEICLSKIEYEQWKQKSNALVEPDNVTAVIANEKVPLLKVEFMN